MKREIHVTADCLIQSNDKILMVKRKNPPYVGHWEIPGGHVDAGELPIQAALREMKEEVGLDLEIRDFLKEASESFPYPVEVPKPDFLLFHELRDHKNPEKERVYYHYWHVYKIKLAWKEAQKAKAGDDAAELKWASRKDLKELNISPYAQTLLRKAGYLE